MVTVTEEQVGVGGGLVYWAPSSSPFMGLQFHAHFLLPVGRKLPSRCFFWTRVIFLHFNSPPAKSLQSCLTLCDPIDDPQTRLSHPWDSSGKNTGVACHFLLQCMKVKRESEVAQLCPTLSDPMDCSPPGSSIHGIFQARVLEWVAIAFSEFTS